MVNFYMKPYLDEVYDIYKKDIQLYCVINFFSQEVNLQNCEPGTTIDQEVCHPTLFDYYQFGHAAIQVFVMVIIFFNNDFFKFER